MVHLVLGETLELGLGNLLTHSSSGGNTTSDHLEETVNVVSTRPLLVSNDIDTVLHLGLLDQRSVSLHSLLGVSLSEGVRDKSVGVESSQGDELPAVSKLSKTGDVSLLVIGGHGRLPVERRRQVVGKLLLGPDGVDSLGELNSLGVVGLLGLHPDQVGVRSEGNTTHDGALGSSLVTVVSLTGTGRVPVEENVLSEDVLGDDASLGVALSLGLSEVGGDLGLLSGGLQGGGNGVVEQHDVGLAHVLVLNLLEGVSGLSGGLSGGKERSKGVQVWVGGSEDEGVVAGVDGGGDEGSSLRVGTGNGKEVNSHNVGLGTDGNETVDVLGDGDEDLSGHVSTLLGTRSLVFNVNSGGSTLNEELGELKDGGQSSVSGVGIGNDGTEVVDVGLGGTLLNGGRETLLTLLAVVEKLGLEEVLDLVGDSVLRGC
jgi:hypothetical protein